MNRMTGMRSLRLAMGFMAAAAAFAPPAEVMRAATIPSIPRTRGEPLPKAGSRSTTAAAMKRAARKRRNVRARASKR